MKIFYISNMYPSEEFPSKAVFIKTIEQGLIDYGAQIARVAVVSIINVSLVRKIIEYLQFYMKFIFWGLFKNDYDLIYLHFGAQCAIPALVVKFLTGKKILFNVHGTEVIPTNIWCRVLLPFTVILLKIADLIVVPSLYCKVVCQRLTKNNNADIFISPSGGVNCKLFKPYVRDINYKKKLSVPLDKIVIGFVSRIDYGKGWEVFLKAIGLLTNDGVACHGLIAGTGEEVEKMHKRIKEMNVMSSVSYIGMQAPENLPKIFNTMDIFVFPTLLNETFGLVGVEAMACGVPTIASNIGAIPEYLKHGENGFLIPPGDYNELSKKILVLINDTKEYNRIRENALETAQQYDQSIVGLKLMAKLHTI
jgi:glycosyltransferase involved in cell wall biosynthesis